MLRVTGGAIGFISLILLFTSAANAQSTSGPAVVFTATEPQGFLAPGEGTHVSTLMFQASCTVPPSPVDPAVVEFVPKPGAAFTNVVLLGSPEMLDTFGERCLTPGYTDRVNVEALVRVARDAPAYVPFTTYVEATLTQAGEQYGPYLAQFNSTPDYYPDVVVSGYNTARASPGGPFTLPVFLTNHGNGPSLVRLSVEPEDPEILNAHVTPFVEIASKRRTPSSPDEERVEIVGQLRQEAGNASYTLLTLHYDVRSSEDNSSASVNMTTKLFVVIERNTPIVTPSVSILITALVLGLAAATRRRGGPEPS